MLPVNDRRAAVALQHEPQGRRGVAVWTRRLSGFQDLDSGEEIGRRYDLPAEIRIDEHQDPPLRLVHRDLGGRALDERLQFGPAPQERAIRRGWFGAEQLVVAVP
jgi:hypothetical protein